MVKQSRVLLSKRHILNEIFFAFFAVPCVLCDTALNLVITQDCREEFDIATSAYAGCKAVSQGSQRTAKTAKAVPVFASKDNIISMVF